MKERFENSQVSTSGETSTPHVGNSINPLLSKKPAQLKQIFDTLYTQYLNLESSIHLDSANNLMESSLPALKKLYASTFLSNLCSISGLSLYLVGRNDDFSFKNMVATELRHSRGYTLVGQQVLRKEGMKYQNGCSRLEGAFGRVGEITFFITLGGITEITYTVSTQSEPITLVTETPTFALFDHTSEITFQDGNVSSIKNTYKLSELVCDQSENQNSTLTKAEFNTRLREILARSLEDANKKIQSYIHIKALPRQAAINLEIAAGKTFFNSHLHACNSLQTSNLAVANPLIGKPASSGSDRQDQNSNASTSSAITTDTELKNDSTVNTTSENSETEDAMPVIQTLIIPAMQFFAEQEKQAQKQEPGNNKGLNP